MNISFFDYFQKNFITLVLLFVLSLVMFIESRKTKRVTNIAFIHIIVLFFLSTIVEYVEYGLHDLDRPTFARLFLSFIGYITKPALVAFAVVLIKKKFTLKGKLIVWAPSIINVLIYSTCFFSDITFGFTEQNGFHRGPLGYTFLAITIANLIILVVSFVVEYRKLSNKELYIIGVLALIVIAGAIFDSFGYIPGCSMPVIAASCLTYYLYLLIVDQKVESLKQDVKVLEHANQSKTVFLNSISHDIRTPMNAIIGFTNLSKENLDNKEVLKDYLEKISLSSEHLLKLINNVLEMSRIESGTIVLSNESFSINSIINNIKSINSNDAEKREINLKTMVNIDNDQVMGDPVRVSQILMNLVSNAIKFTPKDGTIVISVDEIIKDPLHSTYQIIVKDNGIGMSKEFMEKLFLPFEQERSSTISGIQGTGLGLSITKSLVDIMKGTITVDSEKEKGTSFIVTLSFRRDIDTHIKEEPNENIYRSYKNKRVLLVEDNNLNLQIACELLKKFEFTIDTALNGQEAVDKVKGNERYDLILMDIQMPIMDGYEATKQIRNLDSYKKNTPIIATTANAFVEDKIEAFKQGMDGYVSKPIEIKQLSKVLAQCISNENNS